MLAVKLIVNCLLCNCEQWQLKGRSGAFHPHNKTGTPDLSAVNYTAVALVYVLH